MVNWNARKYSREEFLDAYHKTSSINEMLHYLDMRVKGAKVQEKEPWSQEIQGAPMC